LPAFFEKGGKKVKLRPKKAWPRLFKKRGAAFLKTRPHPVSQYNFKGLLLFVIG
jgi:hypothetical protein